MKELVRAGQIKNGEVYLDPALVSGGGGGGGNGSGNQFDTMRHAFELGSGVVRSQTAGMLRDQLAWQSYQAEAMRQQQQATIKLIDNPHIKKAFEQQQEIEAAEIGALRTTMRLAEFDRNTQLIEAGKGGVGLVGDYLGANPGAMGGGSLGGLGPVALGAGAAVGVGLLASRNNYGGYPYGGPYAGYPYGYPGSPYGGFYPPPLLG